jgi:natural resistance-associated macrophage protein
MNVLQSVQLPFAMLPLLHFTSMPAIMGPFANGAWTLPSFDSLLFASSLCNNACFFVRWFAVQ